MIKFPFIQSELLKSNDVSTKSPPHVPSDYEIPATDKSSLKLLLSSNGNNYELVADQSQQFKITENIYEEVNPVLNEPGDSATAKMNESNIEFKE